MSVFQMNVIIHLDVTEYTTTNILQTLIINIFTIITFFIRFVVRLFLDVTNSELLNSLNITPSNGVNHSPFCAIF